MGVATGDMPDVEFIWSVQRALGGPICFGQGANCSKRQCRWWQQCQNLKLFADVPLMALASVKTPAKLAETGTEREVLG